MIMMLNRILDKIKAIFKGKIKYRWGNKLKRGRGRPRKDK